MNNKNNKTYKSNKELKDNKNKKSQRNDIIKRKMKNKIKNYFREPKI
jgi:hypothetical protein